MTGGLVVLIYLFNRGALGLFLPAEGDAIVVAQHINAIVVWSFILIGIAMVLGGVVRATGAAVPPLVVLFLALFVVRIPFAFLMSGRWHAEAVWWSFRWVRRGGALHVALLSPRRLEARAYAGAASSRRLRGVVSRQPTLASVPRTRAHRADRRVRAPETSGSIAQ
jgi:hypothetical protein